jgi:actin-related protein
VGNERFKACEGLFQPDVVGLAEPSVQILLQESLSKADESVKNTLYDNIVITGGSTLLPGFTERLAKVRIS